MRRLGVRVPSPAPAAPTTNRGLRGSRPPGVAVVSALQFRTVLRGLGEKEIPRGYWTSTGVWLNYLLALVALVLAVHFVWSA